MRVGIVSDTHGTLGDGVLEALTGCDLVVHGGDVGSDEILADLERVCGRVVAVIGNAAELCAR